MSILQISHKCRSAINAANGGIVDFTDLFKIKRKIKAQTGDNSTKKLI